MKKFSDQDLKKWKQEINAGPVIASRMTLRRENSEYVGLCPFHDEKTPSFKVYRLDDGTWGYKCFGCGANGNVFQFIQKKDGVSFTQAVEKVLELAGVTGWESGKTQVDQTFGQILDNKKDLVTFKLEDYARTEKALEHSLDGQHWILDRGISMETAKRFHLGFVQDATAVCGTNHPWAKQGWVLFPTLSDDGCTVTSVKYRSLVAKKDMVGDAVVSGILRAKDTSTTLYNLQEVNPLEDVWIVEGEPDTLVISQTGVPCVGYPSAQYNPTDAERDVLMKAARRFLAGDSDAVGSASMDKLWKELRENTFRIRWPEGCKDANDTLLKHCSGDADQFTQLLDQLKSAALAQPIPDYYDIMESMDSMDDSNPMENPRRLHCRTREVDEMAVTLPGNVVSVFASYTGSGKTTWVMDEIALYEAMQFGSVVVNYSAELSVTELATLVAANLTGTDRLKVGKAEYKKAAAKLQASHARFYVGYNPDLNRIGLVLDSLEWAIRRLGANIIVLDHLHFLCRGEKDDIKAQADAMQRIKNISRKYDVIFLVVGQSRKPAQGNKGKSSEQWDAKGSETFTSDATTTYHIHRSRKSDIDWDHPDTWPADILENRTEIRLDKCRTKGPGKAVALQWFAGSVAKFLPYTNQMPDLPPQAAPPEMDSELPFEDSEPKIVRDFNVD